MSQRPAGSPAETHLRVPPSRASSTANGGVPLDASFASEGRSSPFADFASVASDPPSNRHHDRRSRSLSVSSAAQHPRNSSIGSAHHAAASGGGGDNVVVVCRVRPFNARELALSAARHVASSGAPRQRRGELRSVVTMEAGATQFLDATDDFCLKEQFAFDENLWSIPHAQQPSTTCFASQRVVFEKVGVPTLRHTAEGYNTCIFAYGQTGSGKTYTMMGAEPATSSQPHAPAAAAVTPAAADGGAEVDGERPAEEWGEEGELGSDRRGLVPRTCAALFDLVRELEERHGGGGGGAAVAYSVEASFLEIYQEHIRDLLWDLGDPALQAAEKWDGENLRVRHIPGQGPFVVGLTHVAVTSWEHCERLLSIGNANRSMAATHMNDRSSRSHAVFRVTLTQRTTLPPRRPFDKPLTTERVASINLVDLAGSERNKKSGAQGVRLREAAAINQSLTTLKNVIDALVEGRAVVPYRESQLTWLLSESLGGNSKTFMIACVSPHSDNADETLNTLRYALRTQGVVCHARINETDDAKRVGRLRQELEEAQRRLISADSTQRQQLAQEVEERRVAVAELQRARFATLREAAHLHNLVEREREATHTAVYAHWFRVLLCERQADRLAQRRAKLQRNLTAATRDVQHRTGQLSEAGRLLRRVQQEEADASLVLQGKLRAMREAESRVEAVEQRRRELEARDDAVRARLETQRARNELAALWSAGAAWEERRCGERQRECAAAQNTQRINAATAQSEHFVAVSRERQRARLEELRGAIAQLEGDIVAAQARHCDCAQQRTEAVRRLHEAAIFFGRENRALDDDLVTQLTSLHAERSRAFETEHASLRENLAADVEASRSDYREMLHELRSRQHEVQRRGQQRMRDAVLDGERAFAATNEAARNEVAAVRGRCDEASARRERHLADARHFIAAWSHASPRYVAAAEKLLSTARAASAFDATPFDARQLAGQLLPDSSGAAVHVRLRTVAPAPFVLPDDRAHVLAEVERAAPFPVARRASSPPPKSPPRVPRVNLGAIGGGGSGGGGNGGGSARTRSLSRVSLPPKGGCATFAFSRSASSNSNLTNRFASIAAAAVPRAEGTAATTGQRTPVRARSPSPGPAAVGPQNGRATPRRTVIGSRASGRGAPGSAWR